MSEALLEAIEARDVDRLAKLLAAGADANATFTSVYTREFTPLYAAVCEIEALSESEPAGPIDLVILLLRYGAKADGWSETFRPFPLLTALFIPDIECVRLLLAAGANPNICDEEGTSPLRHCAENGLLDLARLLLRCGADKTIEHSGGMAGMNAMGHATSNLDLDMMRLLLAYGADPNLPDVDHMRPIDHLRHVSVPEDPIAQERYQEIRRLLGGT
jgi:uncharacterized protein